MPLSDNHQDFFERRLNKKISLPKFERWSSTNLKKELFLLFKKTEIFPVPETPYLSVTQIYR